MPTKKKKVLIAKEKFLETVDQEKKIKKSDRFFIVGIGASAGGLETLNVFFSIMPPDSGMAFVIIQHLSPQHKSIMASLLEKQTRMAVKQIEDGTKVLPNHVYLNPPGKNVAMFNRSLHLIEPMKTGVINMPVDFFFRSLSEDQKGKAIGIILSGTASDGTLGIKAIKSEGGMAMVQQPDTAKYDGMPRSAVETGLIDFVLPVEKMPEALTRYTQHPYLGLPDKIKITDSPNKNYIQKIFALIRSKTGHDFSHYKPNTISRRIERRLAVHQITRLSDYIQFIQKNPVEIDTLFKNLVIGVTSFFRDPEVFEVIEKEVIPNMLKDKPPDSTIRFWVTGCSTGEEAYSLAIIVSEIMDNIKKYFNVRIFATDIDPSAIDIARRGIYPENIGADISPERLYQFFTKTHEGFHVKKQIRDMIVFSIQNVIKDPPFSRLDLVSCRNLLIYMDSTLQKKNIPLFHYTLNPGGILLLGTSESIGEHTDLFEPFNSKLKIFIRSNSFVGKGIDFSGKIYHDAQPGIKADEDVHLSAKTDIQAVIERTILDVYAPAGVLINDKYEILYFAGITAKYLSPPTGKPSFNVLDMACGDLKNKLTIALHKAAQKKTATVCKDVKISRNGTFCSIDILIRPITDQGLPKGSMLIMFDDKIPADASGEKTMGAVKTRKKSMALQSLEQELQSTREYLQATIEELETSNEELKSANEELQSFNEEIQSSNEELETSKEELQSTNEELATVNAELQTKVEEYSKTRNDMNNLLAATEIATLFIDTNLCIKNYTPAADNLIKLIRTDIGRPLDDLKTCFGDVNLVGLARNVLKDLNTIEIEILSLDDIWYTLKMIPYRTVENLIDGVVMTFINVNKIKQADKFRRLATVLEDSNDAITVLGLNGDIRAWNKGAQAMYGWTESEALKMNISEFLPKDKQGELNSIIEKLKRHEPIPPFKSRRKTSTGKNLEVWLTITALMDETGQPIEIATTERNLAWLIEK
ncbi:chemotaxis protein CheB [Desulfobacula phenolica]|uniref:protein-glutamate O-methyltransferase n=1 Tax=Desulfobacula phenolica TaxID=90732 RepID=A0A1H2FFI3_9BACT|nr:chemotaxis protein CheB [Desulfobacula phenolica]SDU06140.1 two-component system, chemotaxis family, CheB/CheR fusion protein [Desulfobacula phenolica]